MTTALIYPYPQPPQTATAFLVAPRIYWIRMPLPFALNHINLWAIADEAKEGGTSHSRYSLVDTGVNNAETEAHWQSLFDHFLSWPQIEKLVVTHYHPDHIGLAGAWQAQYGVPVAMSLGEYTIAKLHLSQIAPYCFSAEMAHFKAHGYPDDQIESAKGRDNHYQNLVKILPAAIERLQDNDVIMLGGYDWRVITGSGHSPEHLSLFCEKINVLISGDMLLPKISTNIRASADIPLSNPIAWFLQSLEKIKAIVNNDTLILPSHGLPFQGAHHRIHELFHHHAQRSEQLLKVINATPYPTSAYSVLPHLFPYTLDSHQMFFAMGEAIAHLNEGIYAGTLQRNIQADGSIRFVPVP